MVSGEQMWDGFEIQSPGHNFTSKKYFQIVTAFSRFLYLQMSTDLKSWYSTGFATYRCPQIWDHHGIQPVPPLAIVHGFEIMVVNRLHHLPISANLESSWYSFGSSPTSFFCFLFSNKKKKKLQMERR